MKFLHFNNVLCLSPHPDDVEYSMAGTILRYPETHFDILCFSIGGMYDDSNTSPRRKETEDFWKGVKNVNCLYSPNEYIFDNDTAKWVNYIETTILKNNVDCLLIPTALDSHFEHQFVSNLAYPITRILPISIIEYQSPSTLETWVPNLFIDVTSVFPEKVQRLKEFKSQQQRSYFSLETITAFHLNFKCSKRGIKYVELFNLKQKYEL
jgi:LmbE family N-acetylglucosaminyl deacetylase